MTSAALLRDDAVRQHYNQILFLPLGQTPVMEKVRSMMYLQLTSVELKVDWAEAEKLEQLRKATSGRRLLLCKLLTPTCWPCESCESANPHAHSWVLPDLDDLWEEDHAKYLQLCDPNSGSALLISTRMRALCGECNVEIKPPTEEESTAILMAAAGLPKDTPVPREAAEIVDICDSLPLSLSMAGRLIQDLQIGSDWQGVAEILQGELRGHQSASSEQAIIRASLAALGETREADNIRSLFKLFALVPEDTHCPLDCLAIMFQAVHGPTDNQARMQSALGRSSRSSTPRPGAPHTGVAREKSKTPVLLIRKWLKVLIDRSLVLGSVDKPQLHDLVLDFVMGQHTEDQLRMAHVNVVNAFRRHRTVSVGGIVGWSLSNRGDEATKYIAHEVDHHVIAARDHDDGGVGFQEWVVDPVQDYITESAGKALGAELLGELAKEAERKQEFFWAAALWRMCAW